MSRNLGIVLAALCVALGLGSTAHALILPNVLLNVPWTSNPLNTSFLDYGTNNANEALDYTDGTTTTWAYQLGDSIITYDLGSATGLRTVGVATNGAAGHRDNPKFITLNFSNNNFSTTIATDVINLADTMADQDVSFPGITARYVQFVMPTTNVSANFYNDGWNNSGYVLPAEFELYTPEPASLSMLAAGGLLILRRRRGNARV